MSTLLVHASIVRNTSHVLGSHLKGTRSILTPSLLAVRDYSSQIQLSRKVQNALEQHRPVVCLESTIITHGMDYPANLRMARQVEKVIEDHGAVPATIAILNGVPQIGLEDADLEFLARTGKQARKVSRRDMAACQADSATGGTTVSGTMILAKKAGIQVFVTGGIGGVHRGAETTLDVSNDLNELSKNDVAVICAGPKAILDIPLTLEYLETMGVTVTTIGQANLPAFYSRDSGLKSPQVSSTAEDAAKLINANQELQLGSSVLVCVPIPAESSIDSNEMRLVIDRSLAEAQVQGIRGKDTTPFLLSAVSKATKGRSLEANISLVMENARIGAQIAVHLARIKYEQKFKESVVPKTVKNVPLVAQLDEQQSRYVAQSLQDLEDGLSLHDESYALPEPESSSSVGDSSPGPKILVIGGVAVDIACNITRPLKEFQKVLYTSTPGSVERSVGGVAGNIARAVAKTRSNVTLISIVGSAAPPRSSEFEPDVDGSFILKSLSSDSVTLQISSIPETRSATYTVVQLRGELLVAVADMDIFENEHVDLTEAMTTTGYQAIIFDANIPKVVQQIARDGGPADVICFEPTSVTKASRFFDLGAENDQGVWPNNKVNLSTPNIYELEAMFSSAQKNGQFEQQQWWEVINSLDIAAEFRGRLEHFMRKHKTIKLNLEQLGVVQQAIHLLPFFENIYLTMGGSGVLSFHLKAVADIQFENKNNVLAQVGQNCVLYIIHHASLGSPNVANDTGAGDTFTGVLVSALVKGQNILESVKVAQQAAIMTLESKESVSPDLYSLFLNIEQ